MRTLSLSTWIILTSLNNESKINKICFTLVRRSDDFVIYFVRFARYIIRANIYEFHNVNTLLNL